MLSEVSCFTSFCFLIFSFLIFSFFAGASASCFLLCCKDFNLDKAKQKILIESDIDASELYSRLFRLKSAYGSVNGKIFEIVTKSKKVFEERLSFYKNSSNIAKENIKICTGNCSMCEREKCVKDI